MVSSRQLTLYGAPASIERAQALLENLPQVRRIDAGAGTGTVRLLLSSPLSEADLIELLAQSGLSGFRIHI